ncbi:MAG: hypothetical protein IKC38_00205 [Clostridia bacterium]|nr:hypothetical protein [Clostridia bacterium]
MRFTGLYTAIEKLTEQLALELDTITETVSGENIEELENLAMARMREAEYNCFNGVSCEELGGKTIRQYIDDMTPETFVELLGDPMLYLVEFLPDAVGDKVASYAGTEHAASVAGAIKGFCSIKFDSQSSEVATALRLYARCGDGDLTDVIFRLNEAAFRMVEQGDADWEVVQDAVFDALGSIDSAVMGKLVIEYLDEASVLTAMHTPLLRYLAQCPEYGDQAYTLLKRGVKESHDRPFLLELFGKVGNRRGIAFIRGYVEKNPTLVDRLFLTEAVRAILALEGDPNDLIELYQQRFSSQEE